jgi:hypothetical protein
MAFLCAQFGMLAHASTHLKVDPHGAPAAQLCAECLAAGSMQNMVGSAPTVVLAVELPHYRVSHAVTFESIPSRAFTAFRSRAPPISP